MAFAAWVKRDLRYFLPRLDMRPTIMSPTEAVRTRHEPSRAPESRSDAGHAHQVSAIDVVLGDLLDLAARHLNALIEPDLILVQTDDEDEKPRTRRRLNSCVRTRAQGQFGLSRRSRLSTKTKSTFLV